MGMLDNFYVIGVCSNPVRYKSRWAQAKEFMRKIEAMGVNFFVVEATFGDRPFEITDPHNPRHIRLVSRSEVWLKESMISVAISRLPADWEYVAWVDMDIEFLNKDVFCEAWHQLQHHDVIQLFSDCIDLGPNLEVIQTHKGFCYIYLQNRIVKRRYEFAHPGYAWAATRDAIEHLGGLIEAPLGAGDHHMALSLVSKGHLSLPAGIHPEYKKMVMDWQARAEKYIKRNIGYVPGTIFHFFGGKKKDRRYIERWDILTKNDFVPSLDLRKGSNGLLELTDRNIKLRDDIREYFRLRNEDSIDTE